MYRARNASAWLAVLLLAGCTGLKPQTGEVSFRLLWNGKADLDLHVVDPGEGHVGVPFLAAAAADRERYAELSERQQSGAEPLDGKTLGILDIDCNADVTKMCPKPIENIFWPEGQAPRGTYRVWVELFQDPEGKGDAVPYLLEIRRGTRVVQRLSGAVNPASRGSDPVAYAY